MKITKCPCCQNRIPIGHNVYAYSLKNKKGLEIRGQITAKSMEAGLVKMKNKHKLTMMTNESTGFTSPAIKVNRLWENVSLSIWEA
jgi:hypothetical protein